jgi:hypothetical protein
LLDSNTQKQTRRRAVTGSARVKQQHKAAAEQKSLARFVREDMARRSFERETAAAAAAASAAPLGRTRQRSRVAKQALQAQQQQQLQQKQDFKSASSSSSANDSAAKRAEVPQDLSSVVGLHVNNDNIAEVLTGVLYTGRMLGFHSSSCALSRGILR